MPTYPERVYKEWISWNDWLGTNNVFRGNATPVRPFWDAVKWSQDFCSLNAINTAEDWHRYWDEHPGERPADIPGFPESRYIEWKEVGWKGWLGTEVRARLAAAKMSTTLLGIFAHKSLTIPGNVFAVIIEDGGKAALLQTLGERRDLLYVRVYRLTEDVRETALETIKSYAKEHGDGVFIERINDLIFELDMMLQVYRDEVG